MCAKFFAIFNIMSKFKQKYIVTPTELIIIKKNLFKFILISISNFPNIPKY